MEKLKDFKADDVIEGQPYTYGGLVVEMNSRPSNSGGRFAILKLEDFSGSAEIYLNDKNFAQFANYGQPNMAVYVRGTYSRNQKTGAIYFTISSMGYLSDLKGNLIHGLTLTLEKEQINQTVLDLLKDSVERPREERVTMGSLSMKVFVPSVSRFLKFDSPKQIPLTRKTLEALEDMKIDFAVDK